MFRSNRETLGFGILGLGRAAAATVPAIARNPNDWLYRPRLLAELDTRMGGGVVFRQGAHHFDIARLIGGGMLRSVRAATGVWDAQRPTEGSYSVFLEFESGAAANLVYSGYDHFFTTELTGGQTEGGTRIDAMQQAYAAARRDLLERGDLARKRQVGFAGGVRDQVPPYPAHFGFLKCRWQYWIPLATGARCSSRTRSQLWTSEGCHAICETES